MHRHDDSHERVEWGYMDWSKESRPVIPQVLLLVTFPELRSTPISTRILRRLSQAWSCLRLGLENFVTDGLHILAVLWRRLVG